MTMTHIPSGLRPHFQEYDLSSLDLDRDADLIIQRTLEYGTWDEIRWLVGPASALIASAPSCACEVSACSHA